MEIAFSTYSSISLRCFDLEKIYVVVRDLVRNKERITEIYIAVKKCPKSLGWFCNALPKFPISSKKHIGINGDFFICPGSLPWKEPNAEVANTQGDLTPPPH